MKILGIETSCDETAVCIIEADGGFEHPTFKVLGNALYSQVKIHEQYGGVFPALAKREHAKNLAPLLEKALGEANLLTSPVIGGGGRRPEGGETPPLNPLPVTGGETIQKILAREPGLFEAFSELLSRIEKPDIDLIAVTSGPGLEPALWVGINFAIALGKAWDIPVLPTNHMEGHIVSGLLGGHEVKFPALALLISGGHTELVLVKNWLEYEILGHTKDDAIGEAFDKVARLLDLPYPGGPEISKLAAEARSKNIISEYTLPRPMIKSEDYDFSFSGIKTAVLYMLKKIPAITQDIKLQIAREFEDAVTEVLIAKTKKALESQEIKTLIIGGGVVANTYIRESFAQLIQEFPETALLIPDRDLATDNAIMIAMAGYLNYLAGKKSTMTIKAEGNLSL